jgi:hypothetical protein
MPTRISPESPRIDANAQPSVKNLHDRDPLLIPQLFEVGKPPWYRRGTTILLMIVGLLAGVALGYLVHRFGWHGTLARFEHAGAKVMTKFARLVAGRVPAHR